MEAAGQTPSAAAASLAPAAVPGWQHNEIHRDGDEPLAQDNQASTIFTLSEEFTYMFNECQPQDVLHILKDNWHHYSQWIDGVHMSWQDPGFVASCDQLKQSLGSCKVRSGSGTIPLRETVLPGLDRQLDQGTPIPAVEIRDPQHTNWKPLGFFGVILVADIHYYVRCLIAIAERAHADIDHVAYIYEKIQSFYSGNEQVIQCVGISAWVSHSLNKQQCGFL